MEKHLKPIDLSPSELQLLELIRQRRFISIKVMLKNGAIDSMEGLERVETKERIIDMLKQHDFQNIEIKQSHGKIVCIKRKIRKKPDSPVNAEVINDRLINKI